MKVKESQFKVIRRLCSLNKFDKLLKLASKTNGLIDDWLSVLPARIVFLLAKLLALQGHLASLNFSDFL